MKHLALLFLIGLVFAAHGFSELDDYSVSIEGSPSQEGLPELFYGKPDHPVPARREILESKLPERSLIYKFHLPSGTYDHLQWAGHGVPLPATLSIRDYWDHEAAALKTADAGGADLLTASNAPLSLQSPSLFSLLKWLLQNSCIWALAVILFFALRGPMANVMQRFMKLPPDRFRLGMINGKTALLTILALTTVWLSFAVPGAIRFDVGDDPAMEMLASGYVTGHPTEYLIFINVLIGLLLKGFYLLVPQAPWYPLLLLSVVIFSLAGITYLLLQEDVSDRFCWLCLLGVVFGMYFVTHLQFTSAAYLLGLIGMLIFCQGTSRASLPFAAALVAAGSLIRFESFLLLLVTTAGAAWLLSRRRVSEKVIFFAAILFLGWSGQTFDHFYYDHQPDWQAYRQYNTSRGDLNMTAKLNFSEKNHPIYEHVNWSENDFKMLDIHWLYEDPAAFSADKLAYLDQHLSSDRSSLSLLINIVVAITLAPIPVLLLLVILFRKTENPKPSLLMVATIIGPILFVVVYLAITTRLPPRVMVPPLFASSLFLLVATRQNGEPSRRLASTFLLPLTFVTLTVLSLGSMWINAGQNDLASKRLVTSLKILAPYSDKTFVSSINSVLLERLNPLTALAETRNVNIIHLMWSGGSPSFELQLQRHGSASLFQSIAFDPNFWLMIPTSQWDRADCFSLYMQEHYHQKITMTPVILSDGKPAVFPDFTVMKAVRDGQP
jgi:hypothetical protein